MRTLLLTAIVTALLMAGCGPQPAPTDMVVKFYERTDRIPGGAYCRHAGGWVVVYGPPDRWGRQTLPLAAYPEYLVRGFQQEPHQEHAGP